MGERFGELRIHDALAQDAQVLATPCPYCLNMLTDACKSLDKEGALEIVELAELLAASLD
jgi:Fe-S oxidoreductase